MTQKDRLFHFFAQEHDTTLTNGQIDDIIHAVEWAAWAKPENDVPCSGDTVMVFNPRAVQPVNEIKSLKYHDSMKEEFKDRYSAWRYPPQKPKLNQ